MKCSLKEIAERGLPKEWQVTGMPEETRNLAAEIYKILGRHMDGEPLPVVYDGKRIPVVFLP